MEFFFDHEKLRVYQASIEFVGWWEEVCERCAGRAAVLDQLDRASTSIPLNIAEGNGKSSSKDRCRFLEIARASALECAAGLDVLVAKKRLAPKDIMRGKEQLQRIVSLLVGLIRSVNDREREKKSSVNK